MAEPMPEQKSETPERPSTAILTASTTVPGVPESTDPGADPDQYLWGV